MFLRFIYFVRNILQIYTFYFTAPRNSLSHCTILSFFTTFRQVFFNLSLAQAGEISFKIKVTRDFPKGLKVLGDPGRPGETGALRYKNKP